MTKRALISVSDKAGIVEFAQELKKFGWDIISTGGTKVALDNAGVDTIAIDDVTGFPEMMDGRVKTLHPNIHGGLLARRDLDSHLQAAKDNNIELIDLVVVNLYPFKETILKPDVTYADAVENIDIGGPSMLRSAAKNHASVTVVVDPADYAVVLDELATNGKTTYETRQRLAAKVFRHTAAYDALIAAYFTAQVGEEKPEKLTLTYDLSNQCVTVRTLNKTQTSTKKPCQRITRLHQRNSSTVRNCPSITFVMRMQLSVSSVISKTVQLLWLSNT